MHYTNHQPYPAFSKPHKTCVVYVIRKAEGKPTFAAFIASLEQSVRKDFDLFVIFKGFKQREEVLEGWVPMISHPHTSIEMRPDEGYNLTSYRHAAERLSCENVIFFNGSSTLLDSNWLNLYENPLKRSGVGIVGATGSYETFQKGITYRLFWPSFPNPVIRTNGFAMRRELFLKVWPKSKFRTKFACYQFESGYNGLTRRVERLGLEARVINNRGLDYGWTDWKTFCPYRKDKNRLLAIVADKQTRAYENGSNALRTRLEELAWGK